MKQLRKIKPIQKSILLFIARKTIGFKKINDHIGIKEFEWNLEVKDYTIKKNIKELEKLDLIEVEYSSGGKSQSRKRFNEYKISNNILSQLINEWLEIKENNDFTVQGYILYTPIKYTSIKYTPTKIEYIYKERREKRERFC